MNSLPFTITGIVKKYTGNGRKFGYPTANIEVDPDLPEGVFFGYTYLENEELPSIIFIGAPITLGQTHKRLESHILNFKDRDLYGKTITVKITHRLRSNEKFSSTASLIDKMHEDEQRAREHFAMLD